MKYDQYGRELPDPTPVEVPLAFSRPPTIQEMIKQYIRRELSNQAQDQGAETFEEADDFDVDEDSDPLSLYEIQEMLPDPPKKEAPQEKPPAEPAVAPATTPPGSA